MNGFEACTIQPTVGFGQLQNKGSQFSADSKIGTILRLVIRRNSDMVDEALVPGDLSKKWVASGLVSVPLQFQQWACLAILVAHRHGELEEAV